VPSSVLARDAVLAGALTVLAQVELLLAADEVDGSLPLQHAAFAVMTAAVVLRRVQPLAGACTVAAGLAGQTVLGDAPVVGGFLALLVVAASLGYYGTLRQGLLGLAVLGTSASVYDVLAEQFVPADFLGNLVIVTGAWGAGRMLRTSTERRVGAEVARDRYARDAVHRERQRIAHDLHDSVAHALTLMTLQAGGARERATEPVVVDALRSIESEGREAIADMHRALRLLSAEHADAPGLQDLDDLVDRVESGGVRVRLSTAGELASLPSSISSAAYRVVQEGLTNAVKHSSAGEVAVELRRTAYELSIAVRDEGSGTRSPRVTGGSGHGLAGLRERLDLFGGSLVAAPASGTGWLLQATIPLERA
jgi:signal transduction histidine kinase